ncbi:hypothetical protein LOC67_07095 [Stieleria sp. JC731]|uniref:hypothetical protein n=1 Tax=Pirellulaceae TaxID=2691357 RepID=UPI001E2A3F34|nr:hypothetical protein [Stieleria sp. JC731]MCC9600322.1 hypothetical protein [Stieleria sp. JC731]
MAKNTQDREDLLRDGVAMPIRGRIWIQSQNGDNQPESGSKLEVVIGFRRDGRLSLYWDQDPVFQFDANQRLRRVFINDRAYRAEAGRLCLIEKQSEGTGPVSRLQLNSTALQASTESEIVAILRQRLEQIKEALNSFIIKKPNPSHEDFIESVGEAPNAFAMRVLQWIDTLKDPVPIAESLSS